MVINLLYIMNAGQRLAYRPLSASGIG